MIGYNIIIISKGLIKSVGIMWQKGQDCNWAVSRLKT